MNRGVRWLLCVPLLFAACDAPTVDPAEEIAAELRALRLHLAAQARPQATSPDSTLPTVDPKELLQPLRELLAGMQKNQDEMAARQLALAQEMQRWSQLLVTGLGEKHQEESKAMAARLAQLEQSLQQQDTRHREVEALMQGALEKTADRLDEFLRRLQGGGEAPGPASGSGTAVPNGPPDPQPTPTPPGNGATPGNGAAGTTGGEDAPFAARVRRGSSRWWWLLVTAAGCSVAAFFLRRVWRGNVAGDPRPLPSHGPLATAMGEQTAEELWATAALLGEAVDRLRKQQSAAAIVAPSKVPDMASPESIADELDLDELFMIEEEEPSAPTADVVPPQPKVNVRTTEDKVAAARAPTAPVAATGPLRPGPDRVTFRLPATASPEAVLAALLARPFVLRKPAPSVRLVDGMLAVECALLPGVAAGERGRLLQALREAGR